MLHCQQGYSLCCLYIATPQSPGTRYRCTNNSFCLFVCLVGFCLVPLQTGATTKITISLLITINLIVSISIITIIIIVVLHIRVRTARCARRLNIERMVPRLLAKPGNDTTLLTCEISNARQKMVSYTLYVYCVCDSF